MIILHMAQINFFWVTSTKFLHGASIKIFFQQKSGLFKFFIVIIWGGGGGGVVITNFWVVRVFREHSTIIFACIHF